jgi:hypothetical protein
MVMNFHKARELQKDGKPSGRWHYTNYNDSLKTIWPEGYCADPTSPCSKEGHATAEEACACKKRYDLDKKLRFDMKKMDQVSNLHRCQAPGCGEWGPNHAEIPSEMVFWCLCDAHANRETVEKLYEVGESFGSL